MSKKDIILGGLESAKDIILNSNMPIGRCYQKSEGKDIDFAKSYLLASSEKLQLENIRNIILDEFLANTNKLIDSKDTPEDTIDELKIIKEAVLNSELFDEPTNAKEYASAVAIGIAISQFYVELSKG